VTCGVNDNNIVLYHEQFRGQLEKLYKENFPQAWDMTITNK